MVTRTKSRTAKKKTNKGRVKTLSLKRETIKNLSGHEQRKVKGGGGAAGSISGATDRSGNSRY
jgi:hypothetical protein